jgi:hypothetical protein
MGEIATASTPYTAADDEKLAFATVNEADQCTVDPLYTVPGNWNSWPTGVRPNEPGWEVNSCIEDEVWNALSVV